MMQKDTIRLFLTLFIVLALYISANAQSPGGVSPSLHIWLKADSGPEKSPGVPAASGDAISNWLDRSGTAHDYSVVAGPTLQGNALNFNPSVEILSGGFDGPAAGALGTDWTAFFVSKKLASDNNGRLFDGHAGNYLWAHWGTYTNSIYINGNPSNFNSGIATTTGIQNLHLHSYKRESAGGTLEARADGTSLTTFGSSNSASGIRIDINQGAFGGSEASNSRIGEMIVYNTALTVSDVNKVESYLAIKYGMTLAHDYVASDGTILWNVTTNAVYQNNVTGIGRDDASALDQRKSLSIQPTASVTIDKGGALGTDKSFLLWGDNLAAGTSTNISSSYTLRTNRIWKTAVTGAPGSVTFSIDLAIVGFPNTGVAGNYALLTDNDTDFSSGSIPHTGASLVGSVLTFPGVTFNDGEFFVVASSGIVLPGGISGLSVWLKANSGPEKSPGVQAASGDAITNWLDRSGLGNDYAAVAGPTLQGNAINFNPSVEILAGGFDASAGAALGNDWTTFFVSKKLASDNNGRLFEGNSGNYLWAHWGTYTNSIYINGNPSNFNSGIATTTGIQNLHLHAYKRESAGTTLEARADGASLATFGSSNTASGIRIDINQGAFAASEASNSRIGEMIIYNTALSVADVNKVESYLGIKYGMTLAHDLVASDGTILWNVTTNASYQNNVTGIGRDDASALDQRKSLSILPGASVTMDEGGAFGTDKSFIIWGNDLGSGTSSNVSASYSVRASRVWKTGVKGAPAAVTFTVNLLTIGLPNTGSAADYTLLKDTDTDFSSGVTAHTAGASLVGNDLTFTGVTFNDGDFFTMAVANVGFPGGIAGSIFWVKADAGVVAAPDVSTWTDQSGLGNDATQPVGGQQPTPVNSVINFNPVVDFSGGTDIMSPANPPANLNTTVFTVGIPAVNTQWRTMFRGTVNDHPLIVQTGGTLLGYYDGDNVGFKSSGFTWLQNEAAVVGLEMRAGDVNFRKNGTQGASIATINLAGLNLNFFGNYQGNNQQFGRIAETIIYNSATPLTTTEKQKIETYLAVKYGVTLSHDYLASDGTVIWNSTANAAYNNNVAGIGRDDASALAQRKSLSVNAGAGLTIDRGGAFASNKNFLIWGSDLGTGTSANVSSGYSVRTGRIWRAAVTGTPGPTSFSLDLTTVSFPNTGSAADYALLKDTDTDFSSGVTAHTAGASLAGNILTFTGVTFTDGDFFSIAATNVPVPGGIAGAIFWVRADLGVTAAPDVSTWADQSGSSNNATQPVPGQQPSPVTNAINFNPAIDFSGGTDILVPAIPPANLNTTVFTVGIPAVNTQWRTMFRGTTNDHPLIVQTGGTLLGYYDGDNVGFKSSGFTWLQNEAAVVGLEMRTGDVNFRKNGTQGASIATINLAGLNLNFFGNYQGNNQQFGRIAETIIYNSATPLTTTEKQRIETYLAVKYGVTLAHDYLASDGTVIWNSTTNAAYNNNVAGIGRDDASSLDQRKSLSVNAGAGLTIDRGGAFASNKNFLIWGNDANTGTSVNVPAGYVQRTNRIWKAAVTGAPGNVNVSIDLTTIGFPNTGSSSDYALLIDTDTDFSSGATAHTAGASLVGSVLSFTTVNFPNGAFFSLAGANIVLPGGIGGLSVWLKANSGPEKAAGTPAANGDAITNWVDRSGLGHDYPAVAGPTLQDNTLNFNPSVEILSGGFDALPGSELANDWTVFFVSRKLASDPDGRLFDGHSGNFLWAHWSVYTNSLYLNGVPANHNVGIATTVGIQNLHLHTYKRESAGGTLEARADGTILTTFGASNSANGVRIDINQGANSAETSDSRVGEMILYNSTLPATDVIRVESYLGIKYGITLAHDYQASDGTVLWNSVANAAYHNHVTGIGRDNLSSLNQVKSLSIHAGASVTMDKGGAFGADRTFLAWGNDLSTGISTNIPAGYTVRTNRIWKVAVTGTPGNVIFSIDLSALSFPNTGNAADYALLKDTDTDFSSGATAHTGGASLVGSILSFTGVSFNHGDLFAIAAANVPLPGGIAGSVFWVRADLGVTAAPDVSTWADQSGTSNNATQPVAGQQPSPVNGIINFNPVVDFSGATDIMSPAVAPANLNTTVFTVAIPAVNTQWRTMFRGSANDHPLIVQTGGTLLGYYDGDNVGFKSSGFTWLQNEVALVALEMRAGDVNFRKNGAQGASIGTINLAGLNLNFFGNYQGNNQQFGRIAETIVFNTAAVLTATEKQKVESYLGVKYGVTLSHDYLASDATVVWNSVTNAAYHNNVAGIGRDDGTALDQRKSIGINAGAVVTVDKGGAFGANKSYLIWGDNNAVMDAGGIVDVPSAQGVLRRLARVWKLGAIGTVGAVSIQFNLSTVVGSKTAADLRLLIDRNKNGIFSDETVAGGGIISGAVNLGANVFQFTPVTFNDGELISVGTASLTTPLPVSLLAFNAALTDDAVDLTWTTATESNNDYFTLQKSADGLEFMELARLKGAGNSTTVKYYHSRDENPYSGFTYYRLRQTDYDGTSTLSNVISVKLKGKMNIYPNPAGSQFFVENEDIENAALILTNSLGERVSFKSTLSPNKIAVETTDLARGIYILILNYQGKIYTKKIVLE